jgi:hypothetical protein
MTNLLIIKTDGVIGLEPVESIVKLDALQKAVGGYVEMIRIGKYLMWVNEDGWNEGLQENDIASFIHKKFTGDEITIVGNIAVTSAEDDDGEVWPLTTDEVYLFLDSFITDPGEDCSEEEE